MRDCSENIEDRSLGISFTMPARTAGGSTAENSRLGKYPKIKGSQAPQMKNSRTIIRKSRKRLLCMAESTAVQRKVVVDHDAFASTDLRRILIVRRVKCKAGCCT